jgi:hypothetical protein
MGSLEQDISRLQREVNQAFTTLLEQTDAAASVPESDQTLARISAEIQGRVGQANAESARLGSDLALLRDSVDDLGSKSTQSDVLNSLVDRLAGFAPRLVLFVVKGTNALGWAARGFDDGPGNGSVRGLAVSLQSDTIHRLALNTQQTFYGSPDQQSENQIILGRLGRTVPARVLAVPLKVRGKSAAVLYADSSDRGQESINVEAIELLVSTTGLVVELTSLRSPDRNRRRPQLPPHRRSRRPPLRSRQSWNAGPALRSALLRLPDRMGLPRAGSRLLHSSGLWATRMLLPRLR